jgi:hypothetical protein
MYARQPRKVLAVSLGIYPPVRLARNLRDCAYQTGFPENVNAYHTQGKVVALDFHRHWLLMPRTENLFLVLYSR